MNTGALSLFHPGFRAMFAETADSTSEPARTDNELARELARTGNGGSFETLLRRYRDPTFNLVASMLGPGREAEAEDLTQDVFIRAYRNIRSFRHDARFSSWLYSIARNRTLDHLRSARERAPHVTYDAFVQPPGMRETAGPEKATADEKRRTTVLRQVDRLPLMQRTAVYLFYWNGCSIAEAAVLLGVNEQTVKSHLYRARQRLATKLATSEKDL